MMMALTEPIERGGIGLRAFPSIEIFERASGPWTATIILSGGLARLDVFPMLESSVARTLAFVAGSASPDIYRVHTPVGPQEAMLYYRLLLARLGARGVVYGASDR